MGCEVIERVLVKFIFAFIACIMDFTLLVNKIKEINCLKGFLLNFIEFKLNCPKIYMPSNHQDNPIEHLWGKNRPNIFWLWQNETKKHFSAHNSSLAI